VSRIRFEISSLLRASPEDVWAAVSSMRGVNDELGPLLRMTYPRGMERLDAQPVPLGRKLFRSWLLLFGVLPIDYDDLVLTRLDPARGFREESTLLSQRVWIHERTITPTPSGCELVDRLEAEPRAELLAAPSRAIVRALFRHRHKKLRARFG